MFDKGNLHIDIKLYVASTLMIRRPFGPPLHPTDWVVIAGDEI